MQTSRLHRWGPLLQLTLFLKHRLGNWRDIAWCRNQERQVFEQLEVKTQCWCNPNARATKHLLRLLLWLKTMFVGLLPQLTVRPLSSLPRPTDANTPLSMPQSAAIDLLARSPQIASIAQEIKSTRTMLTADAPSRMWWEDSFLALHSDAL